MDRTNVIEGPNRVFTPKFAIIDYAASGDNTVVAAVSGKKIRVVALSIIGGGTATVRFESGAGGTALTGQMTMAVNIEMTMPFNPAGWFETSFSTLLNMELSAAVTMDGMITYIEVPP